MTGRPWRRHGYRGDGRTPPNDPPQRVERTPDGFVPLRMTSLGVKLDSVLLRDGDRLRVWYRGLGTHTCRLRVDDEHPRLELEGSDGAALVCTRQVYAQQIGSSAPEIPPPARPPKGFTPLRPTPHGALLDGVLLLHGDRVKVWVDGLGITVCLYGRSRDRQWLRMPMGASLHVTPSGLHATYVGR